MQENVSTPPTWKNFIASLHSMLCAVSFQDEKGREMSSQEGFLHWAKLGNEVRLQHKCLYLVGNGASASMSSHFAADISKNAYIHTQVFTDLALITAIANDISFEEIFAYPLAKRAQAGDMLVTISSSGNSPNILRAIDVAREMGVFVVSLSSMQGDNKSRQRGNLNIYAAANTYALAETAHAAILHHWADLLIEEARV